MKEQESIKKFLIVIAVVLGAIGVLGACAPLPANIEEGAAYAKALPEWAIIAGAAVIFLIGFSIIWKLIGGFIKFVVIIALALVLAGVAIGIWPKEDVRNTVDDVIDKTVDGIGDLTDGDVLDGIHIELSEPDESETDADGTQP